MISFLTVALSLNILGEVVYIGISSLSLIGASYFFLALGVDCSYFVG